MTSSSLLHSLESSNGSVSTVREQQLDTVKDRCVTITHDNSDNSTMNNFKTRVEPTRFPSLTFISQNATNNDRETSIKNANLKSELIENSKSSKKSKDTLFNNISASAVIPPTNQNGSSLAVNNLTNIIQKSGSIGTLQTVYTDAYNNLDYDDIRPNNSSTQNISGGLRMLSSADLHARDDTHSVYQQSVYSNNPEYHYSNHHYQKLNNHNHNIGNNNNTNANNREDNESFIYNDMNSVDIMSLNDHKIQRKLSNSVFLNNPLSKDNYPNFLNQNNNHLVNNPHSELDFLDSQSISTVVTSNDGPYYMNTNGGNRSPSVKRQPYYPNNLSVSPTCSKVRQVSQKIFNNYNTNTSNTNGNNIGYSKVNLNRKLRNNDNEYYENVDGYQHNGLDEEVVEENSLDEDDDVVDLDDLNDINEHSGLADAESFLAKPYRKRDIMKGKYDLKYQHPSDHLMRNNNVDRKMKNGQHTFTNNYGKIGHMKNQNRNNNNETHLINQRYGNYGSITNNNVKYPYYDPIDEYNSPNSNLRDGNNSPHDYKSMYYRQNMFLKFILTSIYVFVLLLILFSLLKIIIMKNFDNTLMNFEVVDLDNVLVSDEILLLDIRSKASNTNLEDINIWELDLDVFLVTDEANLADEDDFISNTDITILLGNSNKFLTPLKFTGLLNLPTWSEVWDKWKDTKQIKPIDSRAQLKLYQPGNNFVYHGKELSHNQWLKILNSKYKIILRGNLKYSLPLVWQDQFISISSEVEIKPL